MGSKFCRPEQATLRNDTWFRCCESNDKCPIKSLGIEGGAELLAGHISETIVDHPREAVIRRPTRRIESNATDMDDSSSCLNLDVMPN